MYLESYTKSKDWLPKNRSKRADLVKDGRRWPEPEWQYFLWDSLKDATKKEILK